MSLGRIVKLQALIAKPLRRAYSAAGSPELTQVSTNLLTNNYIN